MYSNIHIKQIFRKIFHRYKSFNISCDVSQIDRYNKEVFWFIIYFNFKRGLEGQIFSLDFSKENFLEANTSPYLLIKSD